MHSTKHVKIVKRWDLFQNIESLDNLLLTLKSLHSGDVHHAIHDLWPHFHKEHAYGLGNLTKKDLVCQFLRKLSEKPIPDP